jgi:hypothetical protein
METETRYQALEFGGDTKQRQIEQVNFTLIKAIADTHEQILTVAATTEEPDKILAIAKQLGMVLARVAMRQ